MFSWSDWGFGTPWPQGRGGRRYHHGDLLKLYLYGYLNKIRSSRKLMRECGRNVELWFLLNRLQPDFRAIADFRKEHRKLLGKIFVILARACREMKLMDGGTLCLDGMDENDFHEDQIDHPFGTIKHYDDG